MKILGKKIRFTPKGPWMKGRASFSLMKDEIENGQRQQRLVEDQRIVDLNAAYKSGKISIGDAREELDNIKTDLEKDLKRCLSSKPLSSFNTEIIEKYITRNIHIKTASKQSTIKRDIFEAKRAISLLGNNSFQTVQPVVLQNILNSLPNEAANKSMLKTFRRILRFLERYEVARQLKRKKFQEKSPPFLTVEQIEFLVKNIPDNWLKNYPLLGEAIWISYDLGTRVSELLALDKEDLRQDQGNVLVKITRQYVREDAAKDEKDRIRNTKNGVDRLVVPIDPARLMKNLKAWIKTYPNFKQRELYRGGLDRYIRSRCRKFFGIRTEAVITDDFFDIKNLPDMHDDREYKATHMLRASHAIYWMELTGNETFVANQLGDTPEVVRKHYAGKVNKQLSIGEAIKLRNGAPRGI